MSNIYNSKSITISKALVIISVVLGHILEAIIQEDKASTIVYGFYDSIYLVHMPFYFFLSGYLFKGIQPQGKYFTKKIKHLVIPYLSWLLIFNIKAILGFVMNLIKGNLSGDKLLFYKEHFYSNIYGGMEVHGHLMILWFPMCLFFTQQLANVLMNKFESKVSILVTGVLFYIFGYINQYLFPEWHLPLAINVVFGALPLFLIGYFIKEKLLRTNIITVLIVCCFILFIVMFSFHTNITYHMRASQYGIPIISTLGALGGFFAILKISKLISKSSTVYKMLIPVSNASMTIMYLNAFVLSILRSKGIFNDLLLLVLGVVIPLVINLILEKNKVLSQLFLGKRTNFIKKAI